MTPSLPHLYVDISAHGYGHLAQVGPVVNALRDVLSFRLTVRSALPTQVLSSRISGEFQHLATATDFGMRMIDAMNVDAESSATAYQSFHTGFFQKVEDEAALLRETRPTVVLSDVSYLTLMAAKKVGIPAYGMCSLNWADIYGHFCGHRPEAPAIQAQIEECYQSARAFLRLTPGMEMRWMENLMPVGVVSTRGRVRRDELERQSALGADAGWVLVAMGGVDTPLPMQGWGNSDRFRWVVPKSWSVDRGDTLSIEALGWTFSDILASVDAVVTKPGYGMFTECALNGVPVLYLPRPDWPEQGCLVDWLQRYDRCDKIDRNVAAAGRLNEALDRILSQPVPSRPSADGVSQVVTLLHHALAGAGA